MRQARRVWIAALLASCAPLAAQNLFVNSDLDSSLVSWTMGCGTQMAWASADEAGCPGSGSVHVTGGPCQGQQGAGAGQCIAAGALTAVSAAGRVRATSGLHVVVFQYFFTPDCSGTMASQQVVPAGAASGNWTLVSAENVAIPGGTGSILVGFGAASNAIVEADVDAGYVGVRSRIFREDFEGDLGGSSAACRWSAVVP